MSGWSTPVACSQVCNARSGNRIPNTSRPTAAELLQITARESPPMKRILLSIPHMGGREQIYVREAFATNWLSTVGPNLTAFEREFEARVGLPAVALSSGTAALHLALHLVGVGPGDEVFCSTLTFVAAANAIVYQGGVPVFVDSDRATWNLDSDVLSRALRERAAADRLPKALVVVHLYGQSADMDPILHACAEYGVAVIEDAAEAAGTLYKGCLLYKSDAADE